MVVKRVATIVEIDCKPISMTVTTRLRPYGNHRGKALACLSLSVLCMGTKSMCTKHFSSNTVQLLGAGPLSRVRKFVTHTLLITP